MKLFPLRTILLSLLLLLGHHAALAQPDKPGSDNGYKAAVQEAKSAYKSRNFVKAAESFRRAFEIEPRGSLLFNIGLCYEKAGNAAEAITFFKRFVDAVPSSPKAASVYQKIATLERQMDDRYRSIKVTTDPPGAIIYVDERASGAVGRSPATIRLLPGNYTIIVDLDKHESAEAKVELTASRDEAVDLSLLSSDQVGTLKFRVSERGAEVLMDQKRIGLSPIKEPVKTRVGTHRILVMKRGFQNWTGEVEALPGRKVDVDIQLVSEMEGEVATETESNASIWPWIVIGVGGAALAGGAVTGIMASSLHGALSDKKSAMEPIAQSDIDTGESLVLMTNVLLGTGGLIVAGGLTWWLLDSAGMERNESFSGHVAPTPDGGALVQVGGSF